MSSKRKCSAPARWHPFAAARTGGDQGSPRASPLGEACRTDMVPPPPPPERNLLSLFKGDAKPQSKSDRQAPSLALSLRVGSEEEETQNRPVSATIRGHDHSSAPWVGRGISGPRHVPKQPVQAAAPSPSPWLRPLSAPRRATSFGPGYAPTQLGPNLLRASAGGAPPRMRAPGSPSVGVGLHLAAGATPPPGQQRCDMCSLYYGHLEMATAEVDMLRIVNGDLRGQVWSLREELKREQIKVSRLQQAAAAAGDAGAPSAGASSLTCPACRLRPARVALLPHEHLCLCRRCSSAASRGDPPIACPCCAVARAGAVEAAPR